MNSNFCPSFGQVVVVVAGVAGAVEDVLEEGRARFRGGVE